MRDAREFNEGVNESYVEMRCSESLPYVAGEDLPLCSGQSDEQGKYSEVGSTVIMCYRKYLSTAV